MLIYCQDGKHLINAEQFEIFDVTFRGDGYWNEITAENADNTVLLGQYRTEEQAREVFEKLAQSFGAISTFYIPKEAEDD